MSLWARVKYLSADSKQQIFRQYSISQFPIEVRQHLAIWIENNFLNGNDLFLTPGNPEHDQRISQISSALLQEIKSVAENPSCDDDFAQQKLIGAYQYFRNYLTSQDIYKKLTDCLKEERRLLQIEEMSNGRLENGLDSWGRVTNDGKTGSKQASNQSSVFVEMTRRVCTLVNQRNEWATVIDSMQNLQKSLICIHEQRVTAQNLQTHYAATQQLRKNGLATTENPFQKKLEKLEPMIQAGIRQLRNHEKQCMDFAEGMVKELEELVEKLINEFLLKFKWSEYSLDEKQKNISFDALQGWYAELIETVTRTGQILKERELDAAVDGAQFAPCNLQEVTRQRITLLQQRLDQLFECMMQNSLIVEQQPPQVIKKDSKVVKGSESVSVRFLCGERFLNLSSHPVVKATVINEKQALALYRSGAPSQATQEGCGRVVNNTGTKSSDAKTSKLIHLFRNMSVSSVRRIHKKSEKRAMTEKFCFLFTTEFKLNGKAYEIWCCSVPFIFVVHVCQKPEAWATIFWDNAFRKPNRAPFEVPEEVPWSQMSRALNSFFKQHTETTWDLTLTNIKYLGEKIFGTENYPENSMVSFKVFSGKDGTAKPGFWEWFYATMELTQKHLVDYWNKGVIIGYIDRCRDAEDKILTKLNPGTFILRFSDNTLGALSISYKHSTLNSDGQFVNHVKSLNPFTDTDLKVKSLAGRLNDVAGLSTVYHHSRGPAYVGLSTSKAAAFIPETKRSSLTHGTIGKVASVRKPYVSSDVIMVIADAASQLSPNLSSDREHGNNYPSSGTSSPALSDGHMPQFHTPAASPVGYFVSPPYQHPNVLVQQQLQQAANGFFEQPQDPRRGSIESEPSPQQSNPQSPYDFSDIDFDAESCLTDEDLEMVNFLMEFESNQLQEMEVQSQNQGQGSMDTTSSMNPNISFTYHI